MSKCLSSRVRPCSNIINRAVGCAKNLMRKNPKDFAIDAPLPDTVVCEIKTKPKFKMSEARLKIPKNKKFSATNDLRGENIPIRKSPAQSDASDDESQEDVSEYSCDEYQEDPWADYKFPPNYIRSLTTPEESCDENSDELSLECQWSDFKFPKNYNESLATMEYSSQHDVQKLTKKRLFMKDLDSCFSGQLRNEVASSVKNVKNIIRPRARVTQWIEEESSQRD